MHKSITPDPHFIPGYGGHCPQFMYYIGGTYGKLTHRAILDPCIPHSKDINLTSIHKLQNAEQPTQADLKVLNDRERFVDPANYRVPMVPPGYAGFVPRLRDQVGKRHLAATTTAIAEHEALMERLRCERRNLVHGDLLQSGHGVFERHIGERMMPTTRYRAPLLPITGKRRGNNRIGECEAPKEKLPYSKFTTPHFKENDDPDKWIIYGYCGHIPKSRFLIGMSSKLMTRVALNEFSDECRYFRYNKMCNMNAMKTTTNKCLDPDCDVYREQENIIPFYGGHVPGRLFKVGKRFAVESTNAKDWLRFHKLQSMTIAPPACGEQCRR